MVNRIFLLEVFTFFSTMKFPPSQVALYRSLFLMQESNSLLRLAISLYSISLVTSAFTTFPKVRILGPCRRQSQVELSKTDARALGVNPPVRISGDLEGTPGIKLVGPAGELELKSGVIVAKRHIHIGKKQVEEWGLRTGDIVAVRVDTPDRALIFGDTEIRVQDEEDLALMHIDTDEANAAGMGPMKAYIVEF